MDTTHSPSLSQTLQHCCCFSFSGGAVPAGNRRHQPGSKDAECEGDQSKDLHEVLDWFKGTLRREEAEHSEALGQNPRCPLGWDVPIGRELVYLCPSLPRSHCHHRCQENYSYNSSTYRVLMGRDWLRASCSCLSQSSRAGRRTEAGRSCEVRTIIIPNSHKPVGACLGGWVTR